MTEIADAFDSLFACLKDGGRESIEQNPGASEDEIAAVEARMGFELCPELRDLYTHVNGVTESFFLPHDHDFPRLTDDRYPGLAEMRSRWLDDLYAFIEPSGEQDDNLVSLPGAPSKPFLAFPGLLGIAVECGPIGTGAVMHHDEEYGFFWIARSITELFMTYVNEVRSGQRAYESTSDLKNWGSSIISRRDVTKETGLWRWE